MIKGNSGSTWMYSAHVRQAINNWAMQNRITPQDWKDLVTPILEAVLNYNGLHGGEKNWWPWNNITRLKK